MSDPLSLFANDEDDEVEIDTSTVTVDVSHADKIDRNVDKNGGVKHEDGDIDTENTEESEGNEGTSRQHSTLSDNLAKTDEEMGSAPRDLAVSVDNPEKIVKTMESYIAFTLKTKTTRSDFEDPEYNVKRRYNDFLWLRQQIEDKHPVLIIPPLPEKHSLTIDRFDKDFVKFRQIALDRFMTRLSLHPITSQDPTLKAFLTLESNQFQMYKKQGAGLFSRVTKSLSTKGGSMMLKNRSEEHASLYEYAQSLGQKMGAFERISSRVASEQNEYLLALSAYVPAYENWSNSESELTGNLAEMFKLMSSIHDDLKTAVDETTLKILLPAKEYILFTESIKGALTRRDALQHDHEVITEELVKCREEKQQLEGGPSENKGFLSRSNTEEALQAKNDKLSARITELETSHNQCKAKLEERNLELKTDIERWHLAKQSDMKELICGMADRNITTFDKHIESLESTLGHLKSGIGNITE